MEMSIEIPLDGDGFLRRECPSCLRQFKWFSGQAESTPEDWADPELYHCPYCGATADHDSWWTQEQLEYAQSVAGHAIHDELMDDLARTARRASNDFVKLEVRGDAPEVPASLHEPPDDMAMVEAPCHPFEPLKVQLGDDPTHCLVCGSPFDV